jgi:mannose/cellobiose epimerase-like protein (N-acyl-D-glucosamine 2-epimerase family)
MVQARQIYVFAHAASLGWFQDGGPLAEIAMKSLVRDFCQRADAETSFAFSVRQSGAIVSETRDAYTHSFVLFALSWLYRLNGDNKLIDLADTTTAFVTRNLLDPKYEGMFENFPLTVRDKRQNPVMHLLEAFLSLEHAAPGRGYLDRATALVTLFKERLFDGNQGVLLEHFAQDWSDHDDPDRRRRFEPGHHFEWVWLLHDYEALSGNDLGPWKTRLYDVARNDGISCSGLIYDEVGADMQVSKGSHRIWPHTEGLKAASVRFASGDKDALPFAENLVQVLRGNFLGKPFDGGWTDQIDQARAPLLDYVPASSLYHLLFAAAELAKAFAPSGEPVRG